MSDKYYRKMDLNDDVSIHLFKPPFIKKLPNYSATAQRTSQMLTIALKAKGREAELGTIYSNESPQESKEDFIMALKLLPEAKIFEVSPTITNILMNTDNLVTPTRLPFNPTFIETTLKYEGAWVNDQLPKLNQIYRGLLLIEGEPLKTSGKPIHLSHLVMEEGELLEKPYPNIYLYAVTEDTAGMGHIKISLYNEYTQYGVALEPKWMDERDFLRKFVMNFLDFLNDPDVETVTSFRSDKSVRKAIAKHKKLGVIKQTNVVRLTGKLKIYIDNLQKHVESHRHYTHRFWVRGHWRHLTAKCWTYMRGRKVFIPPYIKGSGILFNRRYLLHRSEQSKRDRFIEKLHG